MPTPEKFLETWTTPYAYGDPKPAIEAFIRAWRAAQAAEDAKADPYHGKCETLVLPARRGTDRGINRERK